MYLMVIHDSQRRLFDLVVTGLLLLVSVLLCLELFLSPGRPITYDGPTHLVNIAHFSDSLREGNLPASWANNFANFGLPTPAIVQQVPFYVGGLMHLVLGLDLITTFNFLNVMALFFSAVLWYYFLKLYVSSPAAALSAFFLMVAPYRLVNIYSRGALPELWATLFLPLVLWSLHILLKKRQWRRGFVMLTLSSTLAMLSHPIVTVQISLAASCYVLFNWWQLYVQGLSFDVARWWKEERFAMLNLAAALVTTFLLCGYYFAPLFGEMKYFYMGQQSSSYNGGSWLDLTKIWGWQWPHRLEAGDFGPRPQVLRVGLLEGVVLVSGILVTFYVWASRRFFSKKITAKTSTYVSALAAALTFSGLLLFLLSQYSAFLFTSVPGVSDILSMLQHHWRFLSLMSFLPPLVLALILQVMSERRWVWIAAGLMVMTAIGLAFSQAYGKNYLTYGQEHYSFNRFNLHGNYLQTVWSGGSGSEKLKTKQLELIEGTGTVEIQKLSGIERRLIVNAQTPVRMVDYTSYFPGWQVTANGQELSIEFQDPLYRGLITYRLEPGENQVIVRYGDTKIRLLGKLVTLAGVVLMLGWSVVLNVLTKKYKAI